MRPRTPSLRALRPLAAPQKATQVTRPAPPARRAPGRSSQCGPPAAPGAATLLPRALKGPDSWQASLQLATGGPSPEYFRAAEDLLAAAETANEEESIIYGESLTPGFTAALVRQGIELEDLGPRAPLSASRRLQLLAAVLQERDALQLEEVMPGQESRKLLRNLQRRLRDHLARCQARHSHRAAVSKRQDELLEAQWAQQAERAEREELRASNRMEMDSLLEELRQEQCQLRADRFRATYENAMKLEMERQEIQQAFLEQDAERTRECLNRREEEREKQKRALQDHHQHVQEVALWARRDEFSKALQLAHKLDEAAYRSEGCLQAQREMQQENRDKARAKEMEYEHQVRRVMRMQEHERLRQRAEHQADSEVFATHCSPLMQMLRNMTDLTEASRFLDCLMDQEAQDFAEDLSAEVQLTEAFEGTCRQEATLRPSARPTLEAGPQGSAAAAGGSRGAPAERLGAVSMRYFSSLPQVRPACCNGAAQDADEQGLAKLQRSLIEPMLLRDALTRGGVGIARMLRKKRLDGEGDGAPAGLDGSWQSLSTEATAESGASLSAVDSTTGHSQWSADFLLMRVA